MNGSQSAGNGMDVLYPEVRLVGSLPMEDRDRMFVLFSGYFADVCREQFDRDLDEKQWVVIQRGRPSEIVHGFSTVAVLETEVDGRPVRAIFNGDTVHDPDIGGKVDLALRAWLQLALDVQAQEPDVPLYWLLMTATHKTYCFLPFLFRSYHPSPHWPTLPEIARRRDALARLKFPDEYAAQQGVVHLRKATPYLPGQAPVVSTKRRNPHIELFLRFNPGFANGNFLVCLAEISPANLTESAEHLLTLGEEPGVCGQRSAA